MERHEALSCALSRWIAGLRWEDIPEQVLAHARLQMLDATGVRIAAGRTELGVRARRAAQELAGTGKAHDSPSPFDAYIEAILTASLDFDDTHSDTLIHPSCTVVPALRFAARRRRITGTTFATALVAGYETTCRLGMAAPGELHRRGFHPTGIFGALGATAAVARAWGFDAARTEHALGLAASTSAGLTQAMIDGSDARYVNAGSAAINGILACVLAAEGLTGAGAPIEGRFGLLRAHVPDLHDAALLKVTDGLGEHWQTLRIEPKPYPAGYVTHAFIDALLAMRRNARVAAPEVEAIECALPADAALLAFEPLDEKRAPQRPAAARVALPHILAEALVYGEIGADSFSEARRTDPEVAALAAKAGYRVTAEAEPSLLAIRLRNGAALQRQVSRRAMTKSDILAKFTANTRAAMDEAASRALVEQILGPGAC